MSHREGNVVVISMETPQQCDDCGKTRELRPYGPNGSIICYECAMKDEDDLKERMDQVLSGNN